MPRISHEQKSLYKAKIRSVLAKDHLVSQKEIQLRLDTEGLHLDRFYLGKLVKEIYSERIHRADRATLAQALSAFEDTMTETVRIAWEIATDPFAKNAERLMALREIREAHNDVFEKLFDAGVFDRKLGTLDTTIRNAPLSDEKKKSIREAFEKWGMIEAPKTIEPVKEDEQPGNG